MRWMCVSGSKKGRNVIAVRAYNPGRSNFQYLHQGYAGLLVAASWGDFQLVTDKSWKCRRQQGVSRNTVPTSLQLFPQEDIDLRWKTRRGCCRGFAKTRPGRRMNVERPCGIRCRGRLWRRGGFRCSTRGSFLQAPVLAGPPDAAGRSGAVQETSRSIAMRKAWRMSPFPGPVHFLQSARAPGKAT